MYKGVFIDMDGTLLRSDHTVSAATTHVIKQLTAMGILVAPVSARPLHGMVPITQKVFAPATPIASLNGSYIQHEGEVIFEAAVQPTDVAGIQQILAGQDVSIMYYSRMEWYASGNTPLVKKEQKITPIPVIVEPFETIVNYWQKQNAGVNKMLIAGEPALILETEKELLQRYGTTLNICKSQPRYLEVMHPEASKTNAVKFLLNRYGIQQDEIIAIGDNYNDAEMIAFAGKGVAMGNAPDDIKAVADYVTDTNNHDGVAKALKHFFDL
ncbi:MAG TPA: Cof-type HAD-IIB family hydrolase [Ferruginibacter sp.]|nr:Cof-type HAD-IIB family hydrolase [Ferruginibacter sp.]HMP21360.1 Cof-type HAD-IIB family hydrolase [Ferruginibacter sp.]